MTAMHVRFEKPLDEGVQVGSEPCACGSCHPTATVYGDDARYERHNPHLAEGPCCCGRFFTIGDTEDSARARAEVLAAQRRDAGIAPNGYDFATQRVSLPQGGAVVAVVADLRS